MSHFQTIAEHLMAVASAEGQMCPEPGPLLSRSPAHADFDWYSWPTDVAQIALLDETPISDAAKASLVQFTQAVNTAMAQHPLPGDEQSWCVTDWLETPAWPALLDAANAALTQLFPKH